jgi:PAS domain S-box-containing protein
VQEEAPLGQLVLIRDITLRTETERAAQDRLSETLLLNRVIAAAASALEPNAVLGVICRELALAFTLQQAAFAVLAESGDHLTVVAEYCAEGRPSALGAVIPLVDNLATQYVFERRAPLVISDAQTDERQAVIHDLERRRGTVSLLIVPLLVHDRVIGTLGLDALEPRVFSSGEIALTQSIAAAASPVLENAQLFAAVQQELAERKRAEEKLARHARELEALHDTSLEITAQLDLPALLQAIVRRAANLLDAPMGGLCLVRPDGATLELVVSHRLPGDYVGTVIRFGEGLSGRVAQTGEHLLVSAYQDWDGRAAVFADEPFQRVLGVPLKLGGGVIGVLDITDNRQAGLFSAEEVRLASMLADQAAIAVQNARLYGATQLELAERRRAEEALQRTNQRLRGLQAIDRALMQARTYKEPIDVAALRYIVELVPCTELDIATFDFASGEAIIVSRISRGVVEARPGYKFALADLPMARIRDEQVFLQTIGAQERELPGYRELYERGIRSILAVALATAGQVFGLFALLAETADFFIAEYVEIAEEVAGQIALSLHQDRLNEQIRRHAQELEQRVAERTEEIQQLSSLQRTILEHADLGIISTTPTGIIQTFNPAAERMLGYAAVEVVGSATPEIWHDAAEMAERAAEFSADLGVPVSASFEVFAARSLHGLPNTYEWTYVHKGGKRFPVLLTVSTLWAEDGSVRGYVGVATDITASKKAEETLTRYAQEVEDLYHHAPCGYHSLDAAGNVVRINDTELNWLGYARTEVIGRQFIDFVTADGRRQFETNLTGRTGPSFARDLECEMVRKDGTLLPVLLSSSCVYAADGTILETRATMFDINERRAADLKLRASEAAMRQANRELARAVRLKDEFLANMSHELRTPLNAILSLTESLAEDIYGPVNEKQGEALHYISESGQHLQGLINDILDLTKVEAGKLELQLARVDVDAICQASLRLVKQQAHEKRLSVTYAGGASIGTVVADERRLKQIIVNLLSNAVKFTPEGGAIGLEVDADPGAETLRFSVWDTGIGIPADQLSQLFQPFVQLDSTLARHYSGTGLGLALVRRLTDLYGGSVEVESEEGVGSCFAVKLPWRRGDGDPLSESLQPALDDQRLEPAEALTTIVDLDQPAEHSLPEAMSHVILVAEDHQVNMLSYRDYLRTHGFEVVEAWDGVEAVQNAERYHPDLIIMDIQMPRMDGLEAIRAIRALPALAGTPIIAVTALAMRGDRERCLAAGANEYVSKPVNLHALVQSMRALLAATH